MIAAAPAVMTSAALISFGYLHGLRRRRTRCLTFAATSAIRMSARRSASSPRPTPK
jgi:hypothetical protein